MPHSRPVNETTLTTPSPGEGVRPPGSLQRGSRFRKPSPRVSMIGLGALAGLLLIGLVAFAVLWNDARSEQSDVDEVRSVAGSFADRFLTLDSEDIDATKTAVLELSTGDFRRTYEEGLETGVLEAILQLGRTRTETTVEEIFVGELDDRAAHVIVQTETVSRTVDPEGNPVPPRVLTFWLELDLVRQGGGWLVDGVRNLNFGASRAPGNEPVPGAGGTDAPTSTAP